MSRSFWVAVGIAVIAFVGHVRADNFPDHRVTIVVPSAPGAGQDLTARALAQNLTGRWNNAAVVENKPGAGTRLGTEYVVRSKPDGHTLLLAAATVAVNATLLKDSTIDPGKDLAMVSMLARVPFVLLVSPKLPVHSVKELIDYSKSQPKGLSYGTSGPGTGHHLNAEMLRSMTGAKFTAVHYGGSSLALNALLGGEIQFMFIDLAAASQYVKDDTLRALAVNTGKRLALFPDIPTVAEAGVPGFEGESWLAIFAPSATPTAALAVLNRDINAAVASPEVSKLLTSFGFDPAGKESLPELRAYLTSDVAHWAKIVTDAGLARSQ